MKLAHLTVRGRSSRVVSSAVLLLICSLGCSDTPAALEAPALDPAAGGQQALADFDTNGDGAIAGAELDKSPGLKTSFEFLDRNHDGRLTADEIAARLTEYQNSSVALSSVPAQVTLDGAPLVDATVTLTPEKFMGPAVHAARGTTNENGNCSFQTEGESLPGIHCGIFRIEVSKLDASGQEQLPAKLNKNTTLGFDNGPGRGENSLQLRLTSR